jgi:hypothetical protein
MSTNSTASLLNVANCVSQENETENETVVKVKPIFVNSHYKVIETNLNTLNVSPKPFLKIIRSDKQRPQTKILCESLDQKKKVMKMLEEKKFLFHTHSEPGNRVKLFVLRKCFYEKCDVLLKYIQDRGIDVSKVTFLVDHEDRPLYLIHTSNEDLNIQLLKKNHSRFDNLIVEWEVYDLSRKRPMPCRNCKRWGHSAINCNHPFRCIKCDQEHKPFECPRKDRNVGSPKCVNCNGEHPANSTNCPSYIRYVESIERRRNIQSERNRTNNLQKMNPHHNYQDRQRERHVRLHELDRQHFPQLPRHQQQQQRNHQQVQLPHFHDERSHSRLNTSMNHQQSYAGVVSRSLHGNDCDTRDSNLFDLSSRFNKIPNIGRTLSKFAELIEKLETSDESQHLLLIMSYCTPQYVS